MIDKIKNELMNNNLELALEMILENEKNYKDNIEFINIKGVLAFKVGELDVAISNLEYALDLCKNNEAVYNIEQGDLEVDICYNLATCYEENQNIDKAYSIYSYILNSRCSEVNKAEAKQAIDRIKMDSKKSINCKYKDDIIEDENEYGKVIIRDLAYKEAPPVGNDIYEVRQNLNKLRDDENPLVSIYVLAYNNLEKYTKKCVESILKYTSDVDYELILVDNGSTDGTYEYFKTIPHDKKKIIKITKNVGVGYPALTALKDMKGKYLVLIANDLIVTKGWLSNLVKCAESDPKIGMVNPVLDYVSNYQSVDLGYSSIEDMQEKAAKHNISDPRKWHERLRLITLGTLFRKECIDMIGITDYGFIHDYADDDITFRVRRAGYKAVLCKDTFISHRGEFTDKGIEVVKMSMKKGSEFFKSKYFGITTEDAMNYELDMLSLIDYKNLLDKEYKVLGIDTLCGTPILELKNKMKENDIWNVKLNAFSTEAKYWLDLNTICDEVVVDRIDYIAEHFNEKFNYIILGKIINFYKDPYKLLDDMISFVSDDGSIIIKCKNSYDVKTLLHLTGKYVDEEKQAVQNLDLDLLNKYLIEKGMYIKNIIAECNNINPAAQDYIKKIFSNIEESNAIMNKLLIDNYIIEIVKK